MCWIHNTSAEHALNKGCSKDLRLSALIGGFWIWAASRSLSISFHRFPSSENMSDGVSRGDLSEVQAIGGDFLQAQIRDVWNVLTQFAPEPKDYQPQFEQLFACLAPQLHKCALEGGFEAR